MEAAFLSFSWIKSLEMIKIKFILKLIGYAFKWVSHVHWGGDAIQPSHPLSSPFPPALNLSQHQGLFQGVSSSHQVARVMKFPALASVLPMNIQGWFPLGLTGLISLLFKGLSRVFSAPQFKSINCLALSFLYGSTLTHIHDYWKNYRHFIKL